MDWMPYLGAFLILFGVIGGLIIAANGLRNIKNNGNK